MVVLEYSSNLGNFEDFFVHRDAAATPEVYEVGLGLFTWLLPSFYVDGDDDTVTRAIQGQWQEGSCQGYNTLQLEQLLEPTFDAVRILGVLSVLLSFSIFLFGLLLSCLSLAHWQRYCLCAACALVAIFNGCTLLMIESGPCTNTGEDASCELDQGGLVAIAAVILWVCSALLSFFFLEPPTSLSMPEKLARTRRQKKKAKAMKGMRKENKVDWNTPTKSRSNSRSRSASRTRSSSKSPKTPSTVYSSYSIPSPRNIVDDLSKAETQQQHGKVVKHGRRGATVAVPTLSQSQSSPPVRVKPQRQGANNKSLETRYVPQAAYTDSYRQPPSQSNNNSNNARSYGRVTEEKKDDHEDSSSEDYDCIPYQRPTKVAHSASVSVPPSPLEQPNQRYRSTSFPKQKPLRTVGGARGGATSNPKATTSTATNEKNEPYHDYVQEVTASRSRSSLSALSTRSGATRQSAVSEALTEDLELQRPANAWNCDVCL